MKYYSAIKKKKEWNHAICNNMDRTRNYRTQWGESESLSVMSDFAAAAAAGKSLQLCPTLCNPIDSSPTGSSIHGIFQAKVLEWGAIAFSGVY